MAIVNFAVPKTLESRIDKTIKEKGFASKAEFFRSAAIHFIDFVQRSAVSDDERFSLLADTLRKEIAKKYKGVSVPSVEAQLKDV